MSNKLLLLACAVSLVGFSACSTHKSSLPPGEYETKKESVNTQGTKTTQTTKTKVSVDNKGQKKTVVEKETTEDPKGLFNKSTSTAKTTTKSH